MCIGCTLSGEHWFGFFPATAPASAGGVIELLCCVKRRLNGEIEFYRKRSLVRCAIENGGFFFKGMRIRYNASDPGCLQLATGDGQYW